MPLDMSDFETRLVLRPLQPEDYDAVVALQLACFPKMKPWTREQFTSQLNKFPEGQLGIEIDGQLVASSASLILNEHDYDDWSDWRAMSDAGLIRNHTPDGDTLYGIEMQVHPSFRGKRLARRLYDARKEVCRSHNLARMVLGGRIPGYAAYRDEMTANAYAQAVVERRLHDPVLTAQIANGFVLKEVISDYLPSDEDSVGYATHLEWPNLDYHRKKSRRTRQATERVRVSLVQYQMRRIENFDDFRRQVTFFVDTSADQKSDFLLFPELFTLQLLSLVEGRGPGAAARQLAEFTEQYLELFTELALKFNVNIIGGSQFSVEDGKLYNVSYLFRRDGSLGKQYKIHVTPNERYWWGVEGGSKLEVFDTDSGRIAIEVCYDVEFPEITRLAVERGAEIIFVPYNTNDRSGHLRVRTCAHARCIENHVFAVVAGCVGNLPFVENADIHYAQSAILTPCDVQFAREGIAAEAHPNLETVLVQDLDLEDIRRHRKTGSVQNYNDRRLDLYEVVRKV